MKFKFLNTAFAGLILAVSCFVNVADAGIIHDFDLSQLDTSDALYSDGSLDGYVFTFEFENSTDFNNFNISNLLDWTVTYDNVSYRIGSFFSINAAALFSQSDNNVFLNIGGGGSGYISGIYPTRQSVQVGRGGYGSLILHTAGDRGNQFFHTESAAWSIRGAERVDASAVPEPSTIAILALGLISLASRRFKK